MANPAYYRNGVPYGADGHVFITITSGPVGPNPGADSNTHRPVYVGWPGMSNLMAHGSGPVTHYDPDNPGHYSLKSIREGQKLINQLITKAKDAGHKNGGQITREAIDLLASLKKNGLIDHAEIKPAAMALEEAVNALKTNVALKDNAYRAVRITTQATESALDEFIERDDVKMRNFKDARPFVFDFVLSISPVYRHIIELWNRIFLPKLQQEMEAKNNLVTYLDRVNIIYDDIITRTKNLNQQTDLLEKKKQLQKEPGDLKNKPKPAPDLTIPVIDMAIKPLIAEPAVLTPSVIDPIVIEPPPPSDLLSDTKIPLRKPTILAPFDPPGITPLRPSPATQPTQLQPNDDKDKENNAIKDAIKFTSDFYSELTEKWGEQSAKIAQELAWDVKGKYIRNMAEALEAFEQYKDVLQRKFSAQDRAAISKALESVSRDEMAKNFSRFSKAFYYTAKGVDIYDIFTEFKKAYETDHWRPLFVKLEALGAGAAASALTAFAYSIILGTPMGILGFAIIMTLVGVFIDDKFVEKINRLAGI